VDRDRLRKGIDEALLSLQDLASFESSTVAAETNVLGILRHRVAPAARFGEAVAIKYRRLHYKTAKEMEHSEYLPEGFPLSEGHHPLSALLVVDCYSVVDVEKPDAARYVGERLYLSRDKRWIIAERVGPCSEAKGASSEWVATCKAVTDRALLDRFALETVIQGLFTATNKVWESLSPRMDAIRLRAEKVQQIVEVLSQLGNPPDAKPVEGKPKQPTVSATADRVVTLNRTEH
jgi:hypothetical protein